MEEAEIGESRCVLFFGDDNHHCYPDWLEKFSETYRLVAQFAETVAREKITYFKEIWAAGASDAEARVKFYRDRLAVTP